MDVALPILLLVGGLALLVLEVFLVSFGAIALVAGGMGVFAVVLAFRVSAGFGWTLLVVAVAGAPLSLWLGFRLLPKLPFGRNFYLKPPEWTPGERAAAARGPEDLLGMEGEALSPLRPAGTAAFGDRIVQVVAEGGLLPKGARVRVTKVAGNRVVVSPAGSP